MLCISTYTISKDEYHKASQYLATQADCLGLSLLVIYKTYFSSLNLDILMRESSSIEETGTLASVLT